MSPPARFLIKWPRAWSIGISRRPTQLASDLPRVGSDRKSGQSRIYARIPRHNHSPNWGHFTPVPGPASIFCFERKAIHMLKLSSIFVCAVRSGKGWKCHSRRERATGTCGLIEPVFTSSGSILAAALLGVASNQGLVLPLRAETFAGGS